MAALSLDLMDIISRDWDCSFVMLCQAFTAADFSCCLFVGLSAFSFVFSKWNSAQSGWDQEIDSAIAEYSTFLPSKTPGLLLLYCMFWVIVHVYYEAPLNQLCSIWLNLGREYISIPGCFCLLSSVSSLSTSNPVPLEAMLMHHTAPPCFTDDVVSFGSWAVPSLLHTFSSPSFWYKLILTSKNAFQKWSGFFMFFLAKSNMALFAPCSEASEFALVKSSIDWGLLQRHVFLLQSVLHLAGCWERVFLYHGEDPLAIYNCCPLWTSRSFYVSELTRSFIFFSEFFFSQFVPKCWFGHT